MRKLTTRHYLAGEVWVGLMTYYLLHGKYPHGYTKGKNANLRSENAVTFSRLRLEPSEHN